MEKGPSYRQATRQDDRDSEEHRCDRRIAKVNNNPNSFGSGDLKRKIMENPVNSIKDPKIRAYFEDITEKRTPSSTLTADELEEGANQFIEGLDKALAEGEEMIARARLSKLGNVPEAISFSYIAKKYFGKSRGWLMQKINGNTVNGKQAAFTEEERKQFRAALQDISKQLSIAALAF